MDEQAEIPGKEQVVVPPDLAERMGEATASIEGEMQKPEVQVANGTEQMSMFAELGKLGKETTVKRLGIMFKDVKTALIGFLPYINKVSEAISPAETVGKTISVAVDAENTMVSAEKQASRATTDFEQVNQRYMKLPDDSHKLEKAGLVAGNKLTAQLEAESTLNGAQEAYRQRLNEATDRLTSVPYVKKEGGLSKLTRRAANIHSDADYAARFEAAKTRATELNTDLLAKAAKKGIAPDKIKLFDQSDVMRWTGNGAMPARTKAEALGRNAKKYGIHMLLENLGPIINPVPDVPGLVTLVSYGAEAFGGQWWAGLVPPAWQYLHNRYEDLVISVETPKKAMEIIKRHWNARTDKLLEAKIEKSAGVFLPKKDI